MKVLFTFLFVAMFIVSLMLSLCLLNCRWQLQKIHNVLEDICDGNLSRRVVIKGPPLLCSLGYEINRIAKQSLEQAAGQRQSEQAYKQLMTNLSHDVKTPLASLVGYLEAVDQGIVLGTEKDEYIQVACERAQYLKQFVEKLFEWVKLDAGEQRLHRQKLDINELSRHVAASWIPLLEKKRLTYEIQIPEKECAVQIDPDAYQRVCNNLFENVLQHSHGDWVGFYAEETAENAIIRVSDNGIGIMQEDIPHIFERLYQCDHSRQEIGNGLGLAITQELIHAHNGTISVQSQPNQKTTFTILLPKAL